jgi:hypothetical protein
MSLPVASAIHSVTKATRLPVAKVSPNPYNPNEMSEAKFNLLKQEIQHSGFCAPIIVRPLVDGTHQIIDGEHRFRALVECGGTEVPAFIVDLPTDQEAQFLTYLMNNIRGEINEIKMAVLISQWRKNNLTATEIYRRTAIKEYKQEQMQNRLKAPDRALLIAPRPDPNQNSFAVLLQREQRETVMRATKLTRRHDPAESLTEISSFYLSRHAENSQAPAHPVDESVSQSG